MRVELEWKSNRRVRGGREVDMVSELYVTSKGEENQNVFWKEVKRVRDEETEKLEVLKHVNGLKLLGCGDVRNRWI